MSTENPKLEERRARVEALLRGIEKERRIGVIGSMNADYTIDVPHLPAPGETVRGGEVRLLPGGKSSNQAACAALLGASVSMFGLVGKDDNGSFLLERLGRAGVDVTGVARAGRPTGTTLIAVDAAGENAIAYAPGANDLLDAAFVRAAEELLDCDVVGLCLETPLNSVRVAAAQCHEAGAQVLLNYSPCSEPPSRDLAQSVDVLLVNEHELAQLTGLPEGGPWAEAQDALLDMGFSEALVTTGPRGSMVLGEDCARRVESFEVRACDTTGCGDAFMGAVLAGLASGYSLREAAELGSCVSAFAALGHGAQASYGTADQVADALRQGLLG